MASSYYTNADVDHHTQDGEGVPGPSNWWRRLRGLGRDVYRPPTFVQEDEADYLEVTGVEEVQCGQDGDGTEGTSLQWTRPKLHPRHVGVDRKGKRQGSTVTLTNSPASSSLSSSSSSLSSPAPLFVPPPSTFSSASSVATGTFSGTAAVPSSSTTASPSSPSSSATSTRSRSISSESSRTFTSLWTTRPDTASPSASPSFIPGRTFNLTLGGTRDDEAIYAVQVELGHGATTESQQTSNYAWVSPDPDEVPHGVNTRRREIKRQSAATGAGYQKVKLQVDLGSSDMWVAATSCTTSDCTSAPALFDSSQAISSGVRSNMTYHSGSVSGVIVWDEVQLDRFAIAYQAFIAGDRVQGENLGDGDFSGVLGMALPANSIISSQIPGTTSSNPDGATFLDNLFGSGTSAPTQRMFSLALERREDVRTTSVLTIGSAYSSYCPSPCSPSYIPIVANPNLGVIGYLHWRIPLLGITATDWTDPQRGSGPSQKTITLGSSMIISRSQPLAVLDSGGVAVLVGSKSYADAIYAAYGIVASSDGYYRMPCKTQLAFSFNFGGQWFPAHPLDMSWPDPSDPAQTTCIGAIQYTPIPNEAGDFIFGSSFLKNAYSIFSYPDQARDSGTWQPGVALMSLTNASVASQDFYAVRTLRQSLAQVSSQGPFIGSSPSSPSATAPAGGSSSGGFVVNTTAIVAGAVVGFFVLAAVAFLAWWFFLKRKYGAGGYPLATQRRRNDNGRGTPESEPASMSTLRTKKHLEALRQKSMIEGYSDCEGDNWTEGGDSVRLGYMPEVPEEAGMEDMRGQRMGSVGSSFMASGSVTRENGKLAEGADAEQAGNPTGVLARDIYPSSTATAVDSPASTRQSLPLAPPLVPTSTRSRSTSRPPESETRPDLSSFTYPPRETTLANTPGFPTPPVPYAQPNATAARPTYGRSGSSSRPLHPRSESMSMSGPFPSAMGRHGGLGVLDASPMYEIRSQDYFEVGELGRGRRGSSVGSELKQGSRGGRHESSGSGSGSRERR